MKAIVYHNYGSPDRLSLEEVAKPVPQAGEVLIEVHATSVNAADWHLLTADIFLVRTYSGLFKPKYTILGCDVAGRVEAVGSGVTQFAPGDEVFGDIFGSGLGAFAEYACTREDLLVRKPANLTFEQAAAVPLAAVTALQGLRQGQIRAGQKVVINGASGGVGTFAVQIAKAFGAEVTAVCSTTKMEMVRSLGADHVIDYTQEDFTKNGQCYDLILAVNGYQPIAAYKRALCPKGVYVMVGGRGAQLAQAMLLGPLLALGGDKKLGNVSAKGNQKDLAVVAELIEAGKVTPVIDRRYPLHQVPDAMRQLGEGHSRGKIVITLKNGVSD
jgi:NADPH:quinone reductase-like Zn-dependent oxidoreductase